MRAHWLVAKKKWVNSCEKVNRGQQYYCGDSGVILRE